MPARAVEVEEELFAFALAHGHVGAQSPDGGDPGKARLFPPKRGDIVPRTRSYDGFDRGSLFECKQRRIADEQGGIVLTQHGDCVGGSGLEGWRSAEEVAQQDFCVGNGAARCGIGGHGLKPAKRERLFDDQLDRSHLVERSDGAAGDDQQLGRQGGDGDQTEVGFAGEQLAGARRARTAAEDGGSPTSAGLG
jgi:hypothetical protein